VTAARSVAAAAITLLSFASGCSVVEGPGGEEIPESIYTQPEAFAAMEAVAADMVAALPDFPGFEKRTWLEHPCTRNGIEDFDYASVELEYQFSEADAQTPAVREEYVDLLKEHWVAQGYEVELDDVTEGEGRTDRSLVVYSEEKDLQITYRVAYQVPIMITSGCMPVSEPGDVTYIPPLGGVEPGGEHDRVSEFFPDGIPTDAGTT
jgi:hypothetical protein